MPDTLASLTGVRRNMSPEEVRALWAQGQQGMTPAMGPMSLADLVMEPVGAFLDEADLAKYALPLGLLGMVKGPKVKAALSQQPRTFTSIVEAGQGMIGLPPQKVHVGWGGWGGKGSTAVHYWDGKRLWNREPDNWPK